MLCGPTVRRLHREREIRRGERRISRRLGSRAGIGREEYRAEFRRLPRQAPPPGAGSSPEEPPFPLSMAALLGMGEGGDVLVLDGRIFRIEWKSSEKNGRERKGACRRLRAEHTLRERISQAVHRHRLSLGLWARTAARGAVRTGAFDFVPDTRPAENPRRTEAFIQRDLIPFLEQEEGGGADHGRTDDWNKTPEQIVCAEIESSFAFIGPRWYALIPFLGDPRPGQFHLRVERARFAGLKSRTRSQVLERYDALLRKAVLDACASREGGGGWRVFFRNSRYSVVSAPKGRYFLCRHVPPYAIEGPDHVLYYFDRATLGIPVSFPSAPSGFPAVWVMHPYSHMFLRTSLHPVPLCMPRPSSYYEALGRMPLAKALVHHLESARMTLCAGYRPGCVPYRALSALKRPTLTREEALEKGIPIYVNPGKDPSLDLIAEIVETLFR